MIKLGTSGFSYDDWIGPFYPADLPKRDWLGYYANRLDTVELNVTYYRLPGLKTVQAWVEKTPPEFTFAVKAHQGLTHVREEPDFPAFANSIRPLIDSGKLACVLAQFPHSFHPSAENRAYLERLRNGLGELPAVVEFRDAAWVSEDTFDQLQSLKLGFCCVDEPRLKGLMPPVALATGPVAYVRLHGRNAAKWWTHEHAWERYDYSYSDDELSEWVPRIRELNQTAPLTLVYANNHYRGQSVQTVEQMARLLDES